MPVPTLRPGVGARDVQPVEDLGEVGRVDPGPVVADADVQVARAVRRELHDDARRSEYFSAFSTRLATICASRSGSASAASVSGPSTRSVMPSSVAAGRNASTAVAHGLGRVDRARRERELPGVDPGEVEQVGDEAFEATRLGGDHPRRVRLLVRRC